MRELLSLRRDEAPIIGEVYRYQSEYLKCVADNCSAAESCEKCFIDVESCGFCNGEYGATPWLHFEQVAENELETAADVNFRHVEGTIGDPPKKDEFFIAAVGLVKFTDTAGTRLNDCAACDLTMSECDSCCCLPHHCYQKVQHITSN